MKMVLEDTEIGDAVVEYLDRRGVIVNRGQLSISATQNPTKTGEVTWMFTVSVKDVELPLKEGPYR